MANKTPDTQFPPVGNLVVKKWTVSRPEPDPVVIDAHGLVVALKELDGHGEFPYQNIVDIETKETEFPSYTTIRIGRRNTPWVSRDFAPQLPGPTRGDVSSSLSYEPATDEQVKALLERASTAYEFDPGYKPRSENFKGWLKDFIGCNGILEPEKTRLITIGNQVAQQIAD